MLNLSQSAALLLGPVMLAGALIAAEPKTEELWPKGAPGALGAEAKDKPTLIIYLPEKASGTGIVVCPGGGYGGLAMDHEGHQIARWLNEVHQVDGWWAQSITVGYERARGMRAVYQKADGFAASASKTVGVPVERLYAAFADEALRARWLPNAPLTIRSERPAKALHATWGAAPDQHSASGTSRQ